MSIMQEEIFNVMYSISKFKIKEEAISVGNKSSYGVVTTVHTNNFNVTIEVSNALRAGTVRGSRGRQ